MSLCITYDKKSKEGLSMAAYSYDKTSTNTSCEEICQKDLCPYTASEHNKKGNVTKCTRSCSADELAELKKSEKYKQCRTSCEYYRAQNMFQTCVARGHKYYASTSEFCTGGSVQCTGTGEARTYNIAEIFRRYATPLVLDLKGNGYKFTSPENGVVFDLNADGKAEQTSWTDVQKEFDDAFLVLDKNKNGQIDNGKELFGDQNGASTGFGELAKYDSNGDGVINKDDPAYFELRLWADMNKNAKVDAGEIKTLEEAGVTELSVDFEMQTDSNGNLLKDMYDNITGLAGQFKMLVQNAAGKLVETVRKMIDVLFLSK